MKRPSDFEKFMGEHVEVRFFRTTDGSKSVIGTLTGYDNGDVSIRVGEETRCYQKAQIAQVRLRIV